MASVGENYGWGRLAGATRLYFQYVALSKLPTRLA